jgi:nitroreductase
MRHGDDMPLPLSAIPPSPTDNEPVNATFESAETLALMARRRSTKVAHLTDPGPSSDEIHTLVRLAARVPDHGKLGPWRFVVIADQARVRAGEAIAAAIVQDADTVRLESARALFLRSPACVMVVSTAAAHPKIPEWEQQLSSGAVCFALLIAAHALGYAGCWITEWPAYDARARAALGLSENERVAGFVHLGTSRERPTERVRADVGARISRY